MSSSSLREEQLRSNRRVARQLLGAVALILAAIGLFTVFGWCVSALRAALDDSDLKAEYADKLYGLVMFDTAAFEDASTVDPSQFRQSAIWGTVYMTEKENGSLDIYERDAESGSVMVPKLEVDTYLANLLGPEYVFEAGSFETDVFIYQYDEEKQCYLLPITGSVALYTPEVEKISRQNGKTYVTVGYIPTMSNSSGSEISLTAPTEPTKYMDFVFTRGENRQWYLTALQESAMKPDATATPNPTADTSAMDTQTMVENNLDSTMTDAAGANSVLPEEPVQEPSAEEGPATEEGEPTE